MPKGSSILKAVVETEREFLLHAPEVLLFSACLGIIQKVLTLERTFHSPENQPSRIYSSNQRPVFPTHAHGGSHGAIDIVMPVTDFGRFSPAFWRWFNWWDDYRRSLTPTEIDRLERLAQTRAPTINDYRPEGDWQTYRQAPPFRLEIIST